MDYIFKIFIRSIFDLKTGHSLKLLTLAGFFFLRVSLSDFQEGACTDDYDQFLSSVGICVEITQREVPTSLHRDTRPWILGTVKQSLRGYLVPRTNSVFNTMLNKHNQSARFAI